MSQNNALISEASASGEEIQSIVSLLEPALHGVKRAHGFIACLAIAISIMSPEIEAEEMQIAVMKTSEYICLLLDGMEDAKNPESKVTLN